MHRDVPLRRVRCHSAGISLAPGPLLASALGLALGPQGWVLSPMALMSTDPVSVPSGLVPRGFPSRCHLITVQRRRSGCVDTWAQSLRGPDGRGGEAAGVGTKPPGPLELGWGRAGPAGRP